MNVFKTCDFFSLDFAAFHYILVLDMMNGADLTFHHCYTWIYNNTWDLYFDSEVWIY